MFKAEGDFSDKVALAAFSVTNFGVFASSKEGIGLFATGAELAAAFDGSIRVSGMKKCFMARRLHGMAYNWIPQPAQSLFDRLTDRMAANRTQE